MFRGLDSPCAIFKIPISNPKVSPRCTPGDAPKRRDDDFPIARNAGRRTPMGPRDPDLFRAPRAGGDQWGFNGRSWGIL